MSLVRVGWWLWSLTPIEATAIRMFLMVAIFFFQAEDGIRAADVTGVQTCALPILSTVGRDDTQALAIISRANSSIIASAWVSSRPTVDMRISAASGIRRRRLSSAKVSFRSEERRVGKECGSRWSVHHDRKTKSI